MDSDRELTRAILNGENSGRSADAVPADNQLSAPRWSPSQPRDRADFEIAIIISYVPCGPASGG